ncbi:MAG: hypothetical protein HZA50_02440 [Planctomycetes bacterium]|nr:hypothetical protein [Planctomycetota bacterium]
MHKFMSIGLVLASVLSAGTPAFAQDGKLKYVRCETDSALAPLFHELKGGDWKKAAGQKGLSSRGALVGTIKAGGMSIMVALDTSGSGKEFDTVRLDPTGKGQFDPKGCLKLKLRKEDGSTFGSFGESEAVEIKLDGKAAILAVAGNYSCISFVGTPTYSLQISFYFAVEGKCAFGAKSYPVRLIDATGRMEMGNAAGPKIETGRAGPPIEGDTVMVDVGDGSFTKSVFMGLYGMPLRVDGKWYDVRLSADKTELAAKQIDLPAGRIKIPHDKWACVLLGKKYLMRISGGREPAHLPEDCYQIVSFNEYGPAEAGGAESFISYDFAADASGGKAKAVEITKDLDTTFPVGSPLTAEVCIDSSSGGKLSFSACLKDALELSPKLIICGSGKPLQPPFITISDSSGRELHKGQMQDKGDGNFTCSWEIPAKMKGQTVVKAAFEAGPFKIESKELKFELK